VSTLTKLQGGYTFELRPLGPVVPGIGASVWLSRVPNQLVPYYGGAHSLGAAVFLSLHAPKMPTMAMGHGAMP
jgi:hypothetical protein